MIGCVVRALACCNSVVEVLLRKSFSLGAGGRPDGGAGTFAEFEAFSIRAHVRYTSKSKSKMPSLKMDGCMVNICSLCSID